MKITKQQNPDGVLYENDGTIEEAITLAAGSKCVHLLPGESHFEPAVEAPTGDEGAVACYAADANKMI
jgi:hypothetical protein